MQRQISSNNQSIKLDSAISMPRAYLNKLHLQTLALALFADIKCLNLILISYSGNSTESGSLPFIFLVIFSIFICSLILRGNTTTTKISLGQVLIVASFFILYFATVLVIGSPRTSLLMFVPFCIIPLLAPSYIHIDAKLLLKAMMILPLFGVFNISKIFILDLYDVEKLSMGVSYAFLVPIIATISYLFLYFKDDKLKWKIIVVFASIINLLYLFFILQYGSRGPVLSIVLLVLSLFLYKKQNDFIILRNRLVIPILTIAIIAFISLEGILELLQDALDAYGLSFRFIDKSLYLLSDNDLSNGRESISTITIRGIVDSPILGHGFDMFDTNTGMLYPHNFLLQLLYDGGLVLFLIVIIPVIRAISKKVTLCLLSEFSVYITLFCSGVIGALFSGDMWIQPLLWLFMGIMMSKTKVI